MITSQDDTQTEPVTNTQLDPNTLLLVRGLRTNFYTYEGVVKALDNVQFELKRGDTLAIVGETGCGKSVTAKSILRLVDSPGKIEEGQVLFQDVDEAGQPVILDLLQLTEAEMRRIRGNKIAIVFQDPATYPNPVFRIGDQIAEVIALHQDLSRDVLEWKIEQLENALKSNPDAANLDELQTRIEEYRSQLDSPPPPSTKEKKEAAKQRTIELLRLVRMPSAAQTVNQYPHELSGGMRQRALIAMALSCNPRILIADEATTALDVTVQAQVLKLLNDIKSELDASIIIITHDKPSQNSRSQ